MTHREFQVDLTDPLALQEIVDSVARGKTAIDAVVFCAGINVPERSAVQLVIPNWQKLIDTNLSAGFFLTRAVLPYLAANGGDVIFITSVSARWPDQSGPGYQAAKAGLHALSQALALELSDRGHRFTSVLPGLIDTPLLDQRAVPPSEEIRRQALRPQDIAVLCGLILSFPRRVSISEVVILPRALQAPGRT
jgi:NAD(P)-dependent dehydrogenase (short-subunit alcohol dehydrogenase family)